MKAIELKVKLTYHQYKILMSALAFFEANKDAGSISCTLHPRRKSGRKKEQKKDKLDITIDENTIANLAFLTAFLKHDNNVKTLMQSYEINLDKLRTNTTLKIPSEESVSDKKLKLEQIEISQAFLNVVEEGIFTKTTSYSLVDELITNIEGDVPSIFEIFYPSAGQTNKRLEMLMSQLETPLDVGIIKKDNSALPPSQTSNSQPTTDSDANKKSEDGLPTVTIDIEDSVNSKCYQFNMIDETGINYKENPAVGREDIIKKIAIDLCMSGQSVILTGHPGVGKTTIVKGLAYSIKTGAFPGLKDYKVLSTTSSSLESGTMYVGTLDTKMNSIIDFLKKGKYILFIDEIHQFVGAGTSIPNSNDIAGILSQHLSSGEIKLIGATTTSHYTNQILGAGDFERRFSRTEVDEPKGHYLQSIIRHAFDTYSEEEEVIVEMADVELDSISSEIAHITERNINRKYNLQRDETYYRCNPDLSLSIIKRAFAIAKCFGTTVTRETITDSILLSELLTENAKNTTIAYINNLDSNSSQKTKVIYFDPNRIRR